ncbi:MAG: hypothetical protein U1F68_10105 [Gammaproteobacteria bacterium]
MNKQALSVTLNPENLLWLRAQAIARGCRSISELLDHLIREARTADRGRSASIRSVVGTVQIAESDPDLRSADQAVRAFFSDALNAPLAKTGGNQRSSEKQPGTATTLKHA